MCEGKYNMSREDFDNPPETEGPDDFEQDDFVEEADSDFEQPTEDSSDAEAAQMDESQAEPEAFSEKLLSIRDAVVQRLERGITEQSSSSVMSESIFEGEGNILGVGLGVNDDDDAPAFDLAPGEQCVNLYVAEPMGVEAAKAVLVDCMGIQASSSDDVPINIIVTGEIDAFSHRFRIRAAPGGVSCGHVRVTAGTLGCLARGRRAPRNSRLLMLSNNHVLANSNTARFRDPILQPGRADGGRSPQDRIAILERFVPINFSGRANYVDCATGWCWSNLVRRKLVYLRSGQRRFFRVSSSTIRPLRNMPVGKSGRTTQLTFGRVRDTSATIRVNYGGGRVALFRDQIAVRSGSGLFSTGGDSGSLIWRNDRTRNAVGLLFAGGGGTTFANKIDRVLTALDINLYT